MFSLYKYLLALQLQDRGFEGSHAGLCSSLRGNHSCFF